MRTRSFLAGSALAAIMASVGTPAAMADPINLGGFTGPITIDFSNYENFTASQTLSITFGGTTYSVPAPAVPSENHGVFQINDILANGAGPNILDTSKFTYVGLFYGINTTNVSPFSGTNGVGWNSTTTGGTFVLYQIPNANINLTNVINQGLAGYTTGGCLSPPGDFSCYNGISNALGATDVLQWTLGSNSLNPGYTFWNPNTNLEVNSGSAIGSATVNGGTQASQFGPNIHIQNDFCFTSGATSANCPIVSSWPLTSKDPVGATAVPEPTTLVLFGSGLLGLGLLRRRRRAQ